MIGADTFSFPAPELIDGTIRSNSSNLLPSNDLQPGTVNSVQIEFDGRYFCPGELSRMIVRYGPASSPLQFGCSVVVGVAPALTTYTTLVCKTSDFSVGIGARLTVNIAGQTVVSNDTITFPALPVITRASGCNDSSTDNSTFACGTDGGQTLTLYGENFVNPLTVTIGGARCTGEVANEQHTRATCTIPPGTGSLKLITATVTGQSSSPVPFLSYDVPTISSLTSVNCTSASPVVITDCLTHGGSQLIIEGKNFGGGGARVLIGSALCQSPSHDSTTPHRRMFCTAPPGTAPNLGVLILQNGGDLGSSSAFLSYVQCQPGYKTDPHDEYACAECEVGAISEVISSRTCTPCFSGKYSDPDTRATCRDCPAGKSSPGGTSSCQNCTIGRFTASAGQSQCVECPTGSYAPTNGSSGCLSVDKGHYQDATGKGVQIPCKPGTINLVGNQASCQNVRGLWFMVY